MRRIVDIVRKSLAVAKDPQRLRHYLRWRVLRKVTISQAPSVLQVGNRSTCRVVSIRDKRYFKKSYRGTPSADECFQREIQARKVFSDSDWIPKIVKKGRKSFLLTYFPIENRLDHAARNLGHDARVDVASQAVAIMFDIFVEGFAHCDFHAENLFFVSGKLLVVDFEVMTPYPQGQRPAFPSSYDIVGEGLKSPENTENMCYSQRHPRKVSLIDTLDVPHEVALEKLEEGFRRDLKTLSKTFRTQRKRHQCQADKIYCSFSTPCFSIEPSEAQRNSVERFKQFDISQKTLKDKSLLDLGSNIGGMMFHAQNFQPSYSLGVEFDGDKVKLSRRISAYSGLKNLDFVEHDIDRLHVDTFGRTFDVVFCLAIEAHVKKPKRLYKLLSEICNEILFFEGNAGTDPLEVSAQLKANGFVEVSYLGVSEDDCIESNNVRPLFVARRK